MKTLYNILIFSILLNVQTLFNAQNHDEFALQITKTSEKIKIDGSLEEEAWSSANTAKNFWRKYPTDGVLAKKNTEVKILFDQNFMYFGFRVEDDNVRSIRTLKRDAGHDGQDGIGIIIDPYGNKTNGFFFVVNAFNAQSDDLLNANNEQPDFSWDGRWYSEVKKFDGYYTIEVAIPFKTLRYDSHSSEWKINFMRVDVHNNEYSCWTKIPVNFKSHDLGYTGKLIWKDAPPKSSRNIDVIPYFMTSVTKNNENNETAKANFDAGFDAKIAVNSSLNLDLTVNPNFSQVEVDKQVTNLTRFNIFFPERRTFFLENADLFSEYGIPPIRPFYSRKIGLDDDLQPIPIYFGARLSGNILPKTRIGIMNMQTGKKNDFPSQNNTAISINQQIWKRSNIKAYFLNRVSKVSEEQKQSNPLQEFGRNAGVEFLYSDEPGNWQAWIGLHKSFKPNINDKNMYLNFGGGYFGRILTSFVDFGSLGTQYYADMGFLRRIENYNAETGEIIRLGYQSFFNENKFNIFPKKGKLNQIQFGLSNFLVVNPDYSFNELENVFIVNTMFKNTSRWKFQVDFNKNNLQFPTAYTNLKPIPKGNYDNLNFGLEYGSDFRKNLSYKFGGAYGSFFSGNKTEFFAGLTYRNQPKLNVGLDFNYYKLNFSKEYGNTELFLLAPRVEYNFSNRLFWTTFAQYNTQRNNININSRLQFRYKPMCDIFLVFSDNYFTNPFLQNKNRALVLKINYLFGI